MVTSRMDTKISKTSGFLTIEYAMNTSLKYRVHVWITVVKCKPSKSMFRLKDTKDVHLHTSAPSNGKTTVIQT